MPPTKENDEVVVHGVINKQSPADSPSSVISDADSQPEKVLTKLHYSIIFILIHYLATSSKSVSEDATSS